MPTAEIETRYFARPEGSASKLSTYGDGWRILRTIVTLYRIERPLWFFGGWRCAAGAVGCHPGGAAGVTYVADRAGAALSDRDPGDGTGDPGRAVGFAGLILDTVVRGRREMRRLAYLAHAAPVGSTSGG